MGILYFDGCRFCGKTPLALNVPKCPGCGTKRPRFAWYIAYWNVILGLAVFFGFILYTLAYNMDKIEKARKFFSPHK